MKFIIDSDFRRTTDTAENYQIDLAFPIKDPSRLRLSTAIQPKSVYPIQTGYNDVMNFTYSGAKSITISSKNYTGAQLASEIQTKLQAATSNSDPTCTYDSQTNKLTIGTTTTALTITADTTSPHTLFTLGFTAGQATAGGGADSFESTNMLDLSYPRYLVYDIQFGGNNSSGIVTETTERSYIVPFGKTDFIDIGYYTENQDMYQESRVNNQTFSRVNVTVRQPDPDSPQSGFLNGIHQALIFEAY